MSEEINKWQWVGGGGRQISQAEEYKIMYAHTAPPPPPGSGA